MKRQWFKREVKITPEEMMGMISVMFSLTERVERMIEHYNNEPVFLHEEDAEEWRDWKDTVDYTIALFIAIEASYEAEDGFPDVSELEELLEDYEEFMEDRRGL